MNKQTLISILNQHVTGKRLDLPIDVLQSDPMRKQFALFLPGENLILDSITDPQEDSTSYTITGTGRNALFQDMTVTARFTEGEPVELSLTAQARPDWILADSLPRLQYTLAAALQFKEMRWQLVSQTNGAPQTGLSFHGTMDTVSSLGAFAFLLGTRDEVLTGTVDSIKENVPTMRLTGAMRGGTDLSFIKLGQINLALVTQAVPPVRAGAETQASLFMEVSTSLDFTARGKPTSIPLTAGIYNASSPIRLEADTTQLVSVGMNELSALLNSIDLSGLSFGEFRLESFVKLTQLTFIVDPLADTKLKSVALTVESAKSWDLLTRADGSPFLTLQNILVSLGLGAPFTSSELSVGLHGEVLLGEGRIIVDAMMSSQAAEVQGYLDSFTRLSMAEVARYFLGETETHTPDLSLIHFKFVAQPGQSYKLMAEAESTWTLQLGEAALELESLAVDWQYTVGSNADARLSGEVQLGGVRLSVEAKYDSAAGWDFTGGLGEGQTVSIGDLLADLFYYFDVELPGFVNSIKLDVLSVHFNTTSKNFDFTIGGGFPVDSKWLEVVLTVHVLRDKDQFTFELSGILTIGEFDFEMAFSSDGKASSFVATYAHTGEPVSLPLRRFVSDHLSSSVAEIVPEELHVDIKDILFAFDSTSQSGNESTGDAALGSPDSKANTQSKFLFALDVGASIGLSDLPLVGKELPSDKSVSVDDLRLLVSSKGLTQQEVAALNKLIPAKMTKLPEEAQGGKADEAGGDAASSSSGAAAAEVIPKGFTVSATMSFGSSKKVLSMPVAASGGETMSSTQTTLVTKDAPAMVASASSSDNAKWFNLQKTFGPVYFDKVGVQYKDAALWFLLNAALSGAGLTISLDGLSVDSPLSKFDLNFELRGLGIDYQGGAVEIGGAFLRVAKDQYDGTAVIKTTEFKLSAIGSYTKKDGHPSLFIYGFLDYPLGGPAFFFVTGLAAGFGYNRKLIAPSIDKVADFPLVQQAVSGQAAPGGPSGALEQLQTYIPPAIGDVFLAVGVKFNSFKLIDSFALLTIEFGSHSVINLLGLSTAIIPTPEAGKSVTPLAEVQIAWKATFDPADGFLGVDARLTPNSYILSRDCHLAGGYAFYSWFSGEHAGDFVQTLGGYHPSFAVPAHYPVVPRLGFNWKVSGELTIKGDAYYALTGSALMAGGHLEVLFDEGDLKAWLKMGADFLISWKPYHYDARIYVDVGVSYTFEIDLLFGSVTVTISVDVGADLHLWGPDFSGTADIDISVISFSISFGAGASQTPGAIDWSTFQHSFLPAENVCSISVKDGLVRNMKEGKDERWIINPKHFSLVVNSAIPLKGADKGDQEVRETNGKVEIEDITPRVKIELDKAAPSFGIGSMEINPEELRSTITITIKRDSDLADDEFNYAPILKRVPAGLWGKSRTPDVNGDTFIEDVPAGFEITPRRQPDPGETVPIDLSKFKYTSTIFPEGHVYPKHTCAFAWERPASFAPSRGVEGREAIKDSVEAVPIKVAARPKFGGVQRAVPQSPELILTLWAKLKVEHIELREYSLLKALNVNVDVSLKKTIANDFLRAPVIGTF